MFGEIDRAGVEATLGRGVRWVAEEDESDVTFLMDKSIREGLTSQETTQYEALIALYERG